MTPPPTRISRSMRRRRSRVERYVFALSPSFLTRCWSGSEEEEEEVREQSCRREKREIRVESTLLGLRRHYLQDSSFPLFLPSPPPPLSSSSSLLLLSPPPASSLLQETPHPTISPTPAQHGVQKPPPADSNASQLTTHHRWTGRPRPPNLRDRAGSSDPANKVEGSER